MKFWKEAAQFFGWVLLIVLTVFSLSAGIEEALKPNRSNLLMTFFFLNGAVHLSLAAWLASRAKLEKIDRSE